MDPSLYQMLADAGQLPSDPNEDYQRHLTRYEQQPNGGYAPSYQIQLMKLEQRNKKQFMAAHKYDAATASPVKQPVSDHQPTSLVQENRGHPSAHANTLSMPAQLPNGPTSASSVDIFDPVSWMLEDRNELGNLATASTVNQLDPDPKPRPPPDPRPPGRPLGRHMLSPKLPTIHRTQSLSVLNPPTGTIGAHQSPFLSPRIPPLQMSLTQNSDASQDDQLRQDRMTDRLHGNNFLLGMYQNNQAGGVQEYPPAQDLKYTQEAGLPLAPKSAGMHGILSRNPLQSGQAPVLAGDAGPDLTGVGVEDMGVMPMDFENGDDEGDWGLDFDNM